jgi:hypothetical protein
MKPKEFWMEYMGDQTPVEFMARFQSHNTVRVVERHVRRMPSLYGIVRRKTWHDTFLAREQLTRARVAVGLAAYLEEMRPEWEPVVKDMPESCAFAEPVEEESAAIEVNAEAMIETEAFEESFVEPMAGPGLVARSLPGRGVDDAAAETAPGAVEAEPPALADAESVLPEAVPLDTAEAADGHAVQTAP